MGFMAHQVYEMLLSVSQTKYFVVKLIWEALFALDFRTRVHIEGSDKSYGKENYANFKFGLPRFSRFIQTCKRFIFVSQLLQFYATVFCGYQIG